MKGFALQSTLDGQSKLGSKLMIGEKIKLPGIDGE